MTRIGGGSNPMNDPTWVEKKLLNNEELTPQENKTLEEQTQALTKTLDTLNQFVGKGDMKAARERVDGLKQQFESLTPDMKDFMYQSLTNKSGLAEKFEYKLSTASREKLLKILNPDHKESQNLRKTDSEKVNLEKAHEKTFEGKLQQASLQKAFDEVYGGNEIKAQLFDDPGFTPKAGSDQGIGDPGFTPNVKPDNTRPQLPNDDPGFTPKLKPDTKLPNLPNNDPGFTPKVVGSDKGLGDPGFTPKVKPDNTRPQLPNDDPGFTPRLKPDTTLPNLPNNDPGFTPKGVGSDKGLGDPGFTPKVKPDHSRPQLPKDDPGFTPKLKPDTTKPQLPTDDPGFTPKVVGSDKGLGDPGFTPKVKPDNTRPQLPNDDPGFTPKVGKG